MAVIGVVLKALEARRYQEPQANQQVRIDHNSNIGLVEAETDDRVRVDFAYTTSYGPLGVVKVEGSLRLQHQEARKVAQEWGATRQLPPDTAQQVHSAIMTTCIPEAVGLAKDIRLPPPIPLPQVRIQEKGQAQAAAASDAYGSPEVG